MLRGTHLIQILQNTLQIKQMIKSKNTISSNRITKKSMRPFSSGAYLNKKQRSVNRIHQIISSLEKNVKDLKIYHQAKDEARPAGASQEKSQKGFRIKRGLTRNSSQSNLKPLPDKSENDIFEIRNEYLKVNGRMTNNIVELYEFYRKNVEKREKSTRILASMELSNGGQSISGGKESLLKHSQLLNYREASRKDKDQSKIDEKNEESNNYEGSSKSPLKEKKPERTSELASELISKGCYNIMNIANLLNSKKYRLTKEKQQSFKKPKIEKSKQPLSAIQPRQKETNKQNSINRENIIRQQHEISLSKQLPARSKKNSYIEISQSPEFNNRPEISFKRNTEMNERASNSKSFECSSISKQDKDIEKKIFEETSTKKEESIERKFTKVKVEDALPDLEESPIAPKNPKEFEKSKYYVMPIPQKKNTLENQNSISLRSTSRIIDIDSLPFDL